MIMLLDPDTDAEDRYEDEEDDGRFGAYWDAEDDEDDDPYGCVDSARCLNPNWHHRLSECHFIEDVYDPPRWQEWLWNARRWLSDALRLASPSRTCHDCGKPGRRLWRDVGDHAECNLPF